MKKYLLILIVSVIFSVNSLSQVLWVPVTHHIVQDDNGVGWQYPELVPIAMKQLNHFFAPANIQFYLSCVGVDTIKIIK